MKNGDVNKEGLKNGDVNKEGLKNVDVNKEGLNNDVAVFTLKDPRQIPARL